MASQWFLGSLKSTTPGRGRRKGGFLLGDPQGVEGEEAGLVATPEIVQLPRPVTRPPLSGTRL